MESVEKNEVDLHILTKRSLRHIIGEKTNYRITYDVICIKNKDICTSK